jgi:hypothetical protein
MTNIRSVLLVKSFFFREFLSFVLFLIMATMHSHTQEKEVFVTGYLSLNAEYINNNKVFNDLFDNNGIDITEASVLTTLKLNQKISIFSVLTYKPNIDWHSVIAELSGTYKFSDQLSLKAGRFLLPINPINAQYYAPMNVGIALPSFITNHKLFPLNMNGLNLLGNIQIADDIGFNYDLIAGQYNKIEQSEDGVLGFFGREGIFLTDSVDLAQKKIENSDSLDQYEHPRFWGTGARLSFDIGSRFNIGIGTFYGAESKSVVTKNGNTYFSDIDNFSVGTDLLYDIYDLSLKASLWFGNELPDDTTHFQSKKYYILTSEAAYTLWQELTPYAKLEIISGMAKENRTRTIFGVNYRPFYEFTIKLEHIRYFQDQIDDFDVFQASCVFSF